MIHIEGENRRRIVEDSGIHRLKLDGLVRLILGIGVLLAIVVVLSTPNGFLGFESRVIQHNVDTGRDASALFYTEVEDYWDLQEGLSEERTAE